jgi:hypothetical protein
VGGLFIGLWSDRADVRWDQPETGSEPVEFDEPQRRGFEVIQHPKEEKDDA